MGVSKGRDAGGRTMQRGAEVVRASLMCSRSDGRACAL